MSNFQSKELRIRVHIVVLNIIASLNENAVYSILIQIKWKNVSRRIQEKLNNIFSNKCIIVSLNSLASVMHWVCFVVESMSFPHKSHLCEDVST